MIPFYAAAGIPFLILLATFYFVTLRRSFPQPDAKYPKAIPILSVAATLATLSLGLFLYSAKLPANQAWIPIGVTITITMIIFRFFGNRAALHATLLINILMQMFFVVSFGYLSDMHTSIKHTSDAIAAATNPYSWVEAYNEETNRFITGYPAGIWLPYAIGWKIGVVPQWINLVFFVALIVTIENWRKACGLSVALVGITFYPVLVSSEVSFRMLTDGHLWLYWLAFVVGFTSLHRGRLTLAAIALGIAIACRQPAIFFIPAVMVYAGYKYGLVSMIRLSLLAVFIWIAMTIPPYLLYENRLSDLIESYTALASFKPKLFSLNAYTYFAMVNREAWARPTQIFLTLTTIGVTWALAHRAPISFSQSVFLSGLTYLTFVLFNRVTEPYYFVPALLLLALGVCTSFSDHSTDNAITQTDENPKQNRGEVTIT